MPPGITDISEYVRYNPLFAAVAGKDEVARKNILGRFDRLPDAVKDLLTGPATGAAIKALEADGTLPPSHAVAVAKLIALAAMGDVSIGDIEGLLVKLNLTPLQARRISDTLTALLEPVIAERGQQVVPEALPEIPPLTPGKQVSARNIIDLRKPSA